MEEKCSNCVEAKLKEETLAMAQKYENHKENLIAILNDVQEKYGYVPTTAQMVVADYLNIPLADVYGVVTFYSRFTTVPKGKYDTITYPSYPWYVSANTNTISTDKVTLNGTEANV